MTPPTENAFAGDARWMLVMRVVGSRHFSKAVQLRELLLYLAKKAITSPAEDVSEQDIGTNVLGRKPDYDPQADNIVRVQMRHLRQKLEAYFLAEGLDETIVISIPKGSHVLRFEPRERKAVEIPPALPPRAGIRPKWLALTVALAALAFLAGRYATDRSGAPGGEQTDISRGSMWSRVFVKDQPTTIVLADSSIVIVQNVLQKSFTLTEYADRSYRDLIEAVPNTELRDALRMISNRQYTSLADATVSGELRGLGARLGARVAVRYARHMHIRDFNSGNFVLIGSRHSIPWVELFEPSLNFHFDRVGEDQHFGFRNRHPATGESPYYAASAPATGPQESFATICLLPNLGRNGTVLLLTGVTMEATEAAGEFSMSNEFGEAVSKTLGAPFPHKLPFFEILLKAASMAGAPNKVEVIAWRKPGS